jgi:predicted nucleotidyltransferase
VISRAGLNPNSPDTQDCFMVRRDIRNGGSTLSKPVVTQKRSSEEEVMADSLRMNGTSGGERPTLVSYQSNSLPSTPNLRSRDGSIQQSSPPLGRNALNISPRSSPADQRNSMPTQRRLAGGCKYETGMARARRRVPYSLGPDKLAAEDGVLKTQLDPQEDDKLSGDMRELYDRLLPSPESERRRRTFILKLEKLLKDRWPDQEIAVNVFGSTGNDLGTSDSDVDICLTTECKELEHVCSLAELLAKNGMEKVVCVSSAKVPIVKVWDPELEIACDMNVNNPIALENTELIRAYVSLDPRVRPLAMIIKHWAKRRILNDAGMLTLATHARTANLDLQHLAGR